MRVVALLLLGLLLTGCAACRWERQKGKYICQR